MAKTLSSQSKEPRFDPWLGDQVPRATTKSLHMPQLKIMHATGRWRILRAATKTQGSQTNKYLKKLSGRLVYTNRSISRKDFI